MRQANERIARSTILKALAGLGALAISGTAYANNYSVKGSDTLFDVISDAMAAWKVDGDTVSNPAVSPHSLTYTGGGSGGAETAMTSSPPTQTIGPMSRNYAVSKIGDPAATPAFPPPASGAGHVPTVFNVVGLDAGVFVEKSALGACANLTITEDGTTGKAVVDNPLALILGGKSLIGPTCSVGGRACQLNGTVTRTVNSVSYTAPDCVATNEGSCIQGAEGTVDACSHPDRIAALSNLQACYGPAFQTIQHFFRRDDNSGTTDTFKERLRIKRFCNGIGKPPSVTPPLLWHNIGKCAGGTSVNQGCYTNSQCPGSTCDRSANEDLDPVRFACGGADATHQATVCTDTSGQFCGAHCSTTTTKLCRFGGQLPSDNGLMGCPGAETCVQPDANCTQGYVVSLTEWDPGSADVTVSIANRVKNDPNGIFVGFAGREAVKQTGAPTKAPSLNNRNPTDDTVRLNKYLLSRRLFLNQSTAATADATRNTVEADFLDWATARAQRCNVDPFVKARGFITCDGTQCGSAPAAGTLCATEPFEPQEVINASCSKNAGQACTNGALCCSGEICTGGVCPAPRQRSAGYACTTDADCTTGLTCVVGDLFSSCQ